MVPSPRFCRRRACCGSTGAATRCFVVPVPNVGPAPCAEPVAPRISVCRRGRSDIWEPRDRTLRGSTLCVVPQAACPGRSWFRSQMSDRCRRQCPGRCGCRRVVPSAPTFGNVRHALRTHGTSEPQNPRTTKPRNHRAAERRNDGTTELRNQTHRPTEPGSDAGGLRGWGSGAADHHGRRCPHALGCAARLGDQAGE